MEDLDKLVARAQTRLKPSEVFKKIDVKTFEDVKRAVADFDPRKNQPHKELPISTTMTVNVDDKNVMYKVDATTKSKSRREILIDGLNIIKARLAIDVTPEQMVVEVNGIPVKPAVLGFNVNGTSWVDPLIKNWFGAYRNKLLICWDLADGYTYKYDIYDHKLTRMVKQNPVAT